ncbi:MAG TPA: glycosyltransferase N-terminal domain-containing protein [Edaphocola sp.]|nr:glycosyltransferase N-terminal domain-containing protein [Edaphocola sp.]
MLILEFLYAIFIGLFNLGIKLFSNFNPKIKLINEGQNNWQQRLSADFRSENGDVVWMHCSSLGEFEQGRPVLESLKLEFPKIKILLTFFSPSGYEVRKNYSGADWVYYLPIDSKGNAKNFIQIIQPKLVIFVKYEYWYHYLKFLHQSRIPVLMISALFQERQVFFKWYGSLHRKMLSYITHFFVQNEASAKLLRKLNINKLSVVGDTRVDRALAIANQKESISIIEAFKGDSFLIVAGSSWTADELLLAATLKQLKNKNIKLLIAPHEIHSEHIMEIKKIFADWHPSLWSKGIIEPESKVFIIDVIGLLAKLYFYADLCWIGGGFNKTGIHNSIEAAVYHKSLVWGPKFERYQEALDLIRLGGATSVDNAGQLVAAIQNFEASPEQRIIAEQSVQQYIELSKGATSKIMDYINQQNIFE